LLALTYLHDLTKDTRGLYDFECAFSLRVWRSLSLDIPSITRYIPWNKSCKHYNFSAELLNKIRPCGKGH